MDSTALKQVRLFRQHLTDRADKKTVVQDLNGLQAQFLVNAFHALKIRCNEDVTEENFGAGLVKNWTVRGTVHVFAEEDLPLFRHDPEKYRSDRFPGYGVFDKKALSWALREPYGPEIQRVWDRDGFAWTLTPERQKIWSSFILGQVAQGVTEREDLKAACRAEGMTQSEEDGMFNPWGGGMRELCERGFLNYQVQKKKAFSLCPAFAPMGTEPAELEMVRRYFLHYAPATVRDAAYYFGWSQTKVKGIMQKLPVERIVVDGAEHFYLGELRGDYPAIPKCILLAGFDQLMLGYRKDESVFLPKNHLRGIFNLAGIVMPAILLDGAVVGRWRRKQHKMTFELFAPISLKDRRAVEETMDRFFSDIRKLEWK